MNRRDFIKGTGLGLIFAPLLPRLAEGRERGVIGAARIETSFGEQLEWCCCNRAYYQTGPRPWTEIHYAGSYKAIGELMHMARLRIPEMLWGEVLSATTREVRDDVTGEFQSMIYYDERGLILTLKGLWWVTLGPVARGELNAKQLA